MGFDADSSPPSSPSSLKQRLRSSICFSCCFRGAAAREERPASPIRSSTVWLRSKAQDLPEIGGRCRGLVARIGRHRGRPHSGDFHYDALSYSLNFDEGPTDDDGDGDDPAAAADQPPRYRGFSSRLPPSPPPPPLRPAVGIAC
ncbi:hypothetical protein MUK42_33109 [Musa troglodytarum]|uniref:Uncharacterized protein n=1 Tax=Musa troglodytarum TaxID=320322 RepID=A0A9E7JUM7_9LILI|nr:hypothetical protein MUK42_33109 [Musa troglodytarum]